MSEKLNGFNPEFEPAASDKNLIRRFRSTLRSKMEDAVDLGDYTIVHLADPQDPFRLLAISCHKEKQGTIFDIAITETPGNVLDGLWIYKFNSRRGRINLLYELQRDDTIADSLYHIHSKAFLAASEQFAYPQNSSDPAALKKIFSRVTVGELKVLDDLVKRSMKVDQPTA